MSALAQHTPHLPVMLHEVLAGIAPREGETILDGTFGAGGYSRALLQAARCQVVALDRDPNVRLLADALAREFPGHFLFVSGRFSHMLALLASQGIAAVDAVVLDIGVSSMQIDDAARGFSFNKSAPLDMRMEQAGVSAADIVNSYPEAQLADILWRYGEEKDSRRIARAIVAARAIAPIETTAQLAEIIARAAKPRGYQKTHPATRSFQALRIEVNQELEELEAALHAAEKLLRPGGRLVVVSFHSLEDRLVKQFLRARSGKTGGESRHAPLNLNTLPSMHRASFTLPKPEKQTSSAQEIAHNPRARSATLRIAIRTSEPAWDSGQ